MRLRLSEDAEAGIAVKSDWAWLGSVTAFLILVFLLGGSSDGQPTIVFLLRILSIALIAAALYRLRDSNLGPSIIYVIIGSGIGLLLLHLVPLPPLIWKSLPGREFVVAAVDASGATPKWMPLSLAQTLTHLSFLALLPPLAAFAATLTLPPRQRWVLVIAILIFVVANIIFGLLQRFQGPESAFYIYEKTNLGTATGTFANSNYLAALLYIAIPLSWALALRALRERLMRYHVIIGLAVIMVLLFVLGLAVAGSRAGVLLGMVSLLGSSFLTWGQGKRIAVTRYSRFAVPLLIGTLLILGQFGMVVILQLGETDPLTDLRGQIYWTTLQAAWKYFPVGSGFGTFVPIYAMQETPSTMLDEFVNHAHNDWLELWLEGGLPAALILAAFVWWFIGSSIRIWRADMRHGATLLPRAATLAMGLLLLHSLVDFPLRAPAIACIFGIFVAVVASAPVSARIRFRSHEEPIRRDPVPAPKPAWRAAQFLAPKNARPFS